MELEGDFNDYYHVSTIKGREEEATQVLSIDFMATLEDIADSKVDIEINGKDVFLIYEAEFYSAQNLNNLFNMAGAVGAQFDKLSKTWMAFGQYEESVIDETAHVTRNALLSNVGKTSLILLAISFLIAAIALALFVVIKFL